MKELFDIFKESLGNWLIFCVFIVICFFLTGIVIKLDEFRFSNFFKKYPFIFKIKKVLEYFLYETFLGKIINCIIWVCLLGVLVFVVEFILSHLFVYIGWDAVTETYAFGVLCTIVTCVIIWYFVRDY